MKAEHYSTISDLWAEIIRMEDTILYFQDRILRKRIAIAEIMAGHESRRDNEARGITTEVVPSVPSVPLQARTIVGYIRSQLNGTPLRLPEVHAIVKQQLPTVRKAAVAAALQHLTKRGEIFRVGEPRSFSYAKNPPPDSLTH